MKYLILLIGVLVLPLLTVGCVSTPVELGAEPVQSSAPVFATLADANDRIDVAAAPVYTRLAQYRFSAAADLRAKRISVEQAEAIQRNADIVRSQLDAGIKSRDVGLISSANALLNSFQGVR